jgi:hypothetical protein
MAEAPGFEADIKGMFREKDVKAMRFAFDLSKYEDVKANADGILEMVANGSMPCDGAWTPEQVETLRKWVEAGAPE